MTEGWSPRRWWVGTFALVGGLSVLWVLATPIFAAPDEPAHVVRAYAAAHGQLLGDEFGPRNVPPYPVPVDPKPWISALALDGPGIYRNWGNVNCVVFQLNRKATADCLRLEGPDRNVRILVTGARHPPWYYLAVGTVSLVVQPGRAQIYAMRLLSALLAAAIVASAVTTLMTFAPRRFTLLGVAIALTPMVFFLMGSVNPSALEITAAIGVWANGAVLALGGLEKVGRRLIHRFGIAATVLVLARPGSVVWLVLIVAVLALVTGLARIRELLRERLVRLWASALAGAVVAQLAWTWYSDAADPRKALQSLPLPGSTPTSEIIRHIIGTQYTFLREMVGVFGWLDTRPPSATFLFWMLAVGCAIGLALVFARRKIVLALGVLFALCVIVPIVYEGSLVRSVGYFFQGRYLIPLAVGLPILAAIGVGDADPLPRRVILPIGIGLAVAHFIGFAQALRRYSVGANGTIWFFTAARWEPPVPSAVLLVVFAVVLAAGVRALCRTSIDAIDEATAPSTPSIDVRA